MNLHNLGGKGTVPICAKHPSGRSGKWDCPLFPAAATRARPMRPWRRAMAVRGARPAGCSIWSSSISRHAADLRPRKTGDAIRDADGHFIPQRGRRQDQRQHRAGRRAARATENLIAVLFQPRFAEPHVRDAGGHRQGLPHEVRPRALAQVRPDRIDELHADHRVEIASLLFDRAGHGGDTAGRLGQAGRGVVAVTHDVIGQEHAERAAQVPPGVGPRIDDAAQRQLAASAS